METQKIEISTRHTGKMHGMYSISTSPLENPHCKAYRKCKGSICEHCYSCAMQTRFDTLHERLLRNTEILTTNSKAWETVPKLNCLYFRFEAFGDLINVIQVHNYFMICRNNPKVKFALWTKNPHIIQDYLNCENAVKKPKNLSIIYSNLFINTEPPLNVLNAYSFIDRVFSVYDDKCIKENHISINCGARNCLECHRCYDGKCKIINEKLK